MDSSSFEHVVSVRGAVFAAVACATAPERTPLTPNRSGLVPRSLTGTHETSWPGQRQASSGWGGATQDEVFKTQAEN